MAHLGETVDIHVGGQDLLFPHHENEVAQSEAATGQQFARYWLHVRLLDAADEEKMSSSLGNFETVAEAVETHGANAVRTFLLSTAYHSEAVYSAETVREAGQRWTSLERGYERAVEACDSVDAKAAVIDGTLRDAVNETREAFTAAMNDDFNTRRALATLEELVSAVNTHVDGREAYDYRGLRRAVETLAELGGEVFGLEFGDTGRGGEVSIAADLVELILDVRERERAAGNYDRADELRDELEGLGVEVGDTDDGPTYRL